MNPYSILGTDSSASIEEIKNAYENTIKTYDITQLEDPSLKDSYIEKLNEANKAYQIACENITYTEVRLLIEEDNFVCAESKLNLLSDSSCAEWNYLKGILLLKKGWIESGRNHILRATNINPDSEEYSLSLSSLNEKVKKYKTSNKFSKELCNNTPNKNGLC